MSTVAELNGLVADMQRRLDTMELAQSAVTGGQCTPAFPHPEGLVFYRGPNHYVCQCGKVYLKDGAGGLREGT